VGYAASELANRLDLLRLMQLFLHQPALCHVAGDFCESNKLIIRRSASSRTLAQNLVPSFLTRHPSPSNFPVSSAIRKARCGKPLLRSSEV
jgi:hypothetical protein